MILLEEQRRDFNINDITNGSIDLNWIEIKRMLTRK
jgi:hypothetical protein